MTGRLRELAERPVAPGAARAIVATALAVTVALGCVVALGLGAHRQLFARDDARHGEVGPGRPVAVPAAEAPDAARQDPQDRPGTAAHRRADRELATHRALQHVPWHRGEVSIRLIGARAARAVLSVVGPTTGVDRRAYRVFLRHFHDDGSSYLPRFEVADGDRA